MWNPFNRRNLFSAKRHNNVANLVHSLCNLQVVRGSKDKITVTESNAILELKRTISSGGDETGNVNYRGLWSSSEDYAIHDLVYNATRQTYIAEAASGPSSGGAQTPTFPEPTSGTIYWRLLAPRQSGGMTFRGEYSSTYPGDYQVQDVVVVRSGTNAGTFVCVKAGPNIASNPPATPDAGGYWVNISPAAPVGEWI